MSFFTSVLHFFKGNAKNYAHRDRSIEIIAEEQGLDIESIRTDILERLEREGRVEAIEYLTHRFHVPLSAAWRFVDKLDSR